MTITVTRDRADELAGITAWTVADEMWSHIRNQIVDDYERNYTEEVLMNVVLSMVERNPNPLLDFDELSEDLQWFIYIIEMLELYNNPLRVVMSVSPSEEEIMYEVYVDGGKSTKAMTFSTTIGISSSIRDECIIAGAQLTYDLRFR